VSDEAENNSLLELERQIRLAANTVVQPRAGDDLLSERERTHGGFEGTALTIKELCRRMETTPNWVTLTDVQRYALEQIAVKIGRVLNGDPYHRDHWRDIAGYALIVARLCHA
jgi:hypothetical protein